ncbi:guanine nucleotide-binding protein G(q) subunit alpha isoform X1 [Procambarus clarkii]|uniref:guanine nucleotide-binding protein G(q) subunit alpha isoform X1 n=1 Tax=Procambarus clarkii TaxID=6728 RepID=UPI001E675C63|nr:guanine nucleotide-binding protein subunit alpha-11-like isoform X2 [Procambarus clarkii]
MEADNWSDGDATRRRSALHRVWRALVGFLRRLRPWIWFRARSSTWRWGAGQQPPVQEARVLVLGASDTGKSTFMKQMKHVFGRGYPVDDRRRHQPHIRRNLLESLHKIVVAMGNYDIIYDTLETEAAAQRFTDMEHLDEFLREDAPIDPLLVEQTRLLWSDSGVQNVYLRGNEYHLMSNAEHFISHADRILNENYIPTVEDILRMRYPTRGSVTSTYDLGDIRMTMHDIGGQRPERSEWVNQLHDPTAILFLASLSEYDQRVEEAPEDKNRVEESLDIFEDLLDYPPFKATPVILLLNKSDIFHRKIQYHNLRDYFPSYDGPSDDELTGRDFIAGLYKDVALRHGRHFVVRFTEATNTENFMAIFSFIRANVSRNIMSRGGLF